HRLIVVAFDRDGTLSAVMLHKLDHTLRVGPVTDKVPEKDKPLGSLRAGVRQTRFQSTDIGVNVRKQSDDQSCPSENRPSRPEFSGAGHARNMQAHVPW